MKLEINDNITVSDLQIQFTNLFPYLKIMLFKSSHELNEGSEKKFLINNNVKLKKLKHVNGNISFDENTTVGELEEMFKKNLGLNLQVFRRSGRSWIETTVTDNWTLKKQNEQGQEISNLGF